MIKKIPDIDIFIQDKLETKQFSLVKHCVWISLLSVFPLTYCGLYFAIRDTIKTESVVYPDIVRVSSSGPAAELYPDSLGDYYLLADTFFNDFPVYEHSARDDRFIINNGNHIVSTVSVYLLVYFSQFLVDYTGDF